MECISHWNGGYNRVKILGKVEILVCRILCFLSTVMKFGLTSTPSKETSLVVFDVDTHITLTT